MSATKKKDIDINTQKEIETKEETLENTEKVKITKDHNLLKLLDEYPDLEEILYDFGLHCAGCAFSAFDSIETGAKLHQLDDGDIQDMVDRINEFIEFGE